MHQQPDPRRRSERSRRAVLDAAISLCSRAGYGRISVEAIAAEAGVSKKTIYRWWPSKGAVLLDAVTETVIANTPFPDTGDIAADLRTHIWGLLTLIGVSPLGPAYSGILAEMQSDEALATTVNEQLIGPRVAAAVGRLRTAQHQGQLPEDIDLELLVEQLYGPVYYRHILHKPRYGPDRVAALVRQVLRGAGAPPAVTAGHGSGPDDG